MSNLLKKTDSETKIANIENKIPGTTDLIKKVIMTQKLIRIYYFDKRDD